MRNPPTLRTSKLYLFGLFMLNAFVCFVFGLVSLVVGVLISNIMVLALRPFPVFYLNNEDWDSIQMDGDKTVAAMLVGMSTGFTAVFYMREWVLTSLLGSYW